MKFRKIAEWEYHGREPGGDEVFLLEAIELKDPSELTSRS